MTKCACKGSFLDKLIQPSILVLLSKESMHGFSIHKALIESDVMDYSGIDPTGLYRTLKKMEEAGVLKSEWDTDTTAQARRIYAMTEDGRDCLKYWGKTLDSYKKSIESLTAVVQKSIDEF